MRSTVLGHSAQDQPASPPFRAYALLIDGATVWIAFCLAILVLDLPPTLSLGTSLAFLGSASLAWGIPRFAFARTIGSTVWQLKRAQGRWLQVRKIEVSSSMIAIFLTLLSIVGALWSTEKTILSNPLWIIASETTLTPFQPPTESNAGKWTVLPFYYTLGAWPSEFEGRPVFYSLPYAKGPPNRFAGQITARWEMPGIRVEFEGPKSPAHRVRAQRLRECLTSLPTPECIGIRETTLLRHAHETRAIHPRSWGMEWILVKNPAIPPEEQTQGIYISAKNDKQGQDRFILITAEGAQQAFILDYPQNPQGRSARELFMKAVRSLRASDQLSPGRAWAEKHLQAIRLDELMKQAQTSADPLSFAAQMAETQAWLVARISVEPKSFETYYHLAGTSLLLLRQATRYQDRLNTSEWSAVSKPLVQASYRYAQDVAPSDPRIAQMHGFWLEAQKY